MVGVPMVELSVQGLAQLVLLLLVAKGLGRVSARLGLTRVIGELATGFVLGPSILGGLAPGVYAALFPGGPSSLLDVLSLVGLVLLLTLAGMEMDFPLVRRNVRDVVIIGSLGLAVPFVLGVGLGLILPVALLTGTTTRLIFTLFFATALSISAIPVIVRVLVDVDVFTRPFGQLTVAIAMYTDVIGWVLVSALVGVARTGRLDVSAVGSVVLALVGFVGGVVLLGQRLLDRGLAVLGDHSGGGHFLLVLVGAFGASAITIGLGLEPALGAFVVGLLVARSDTVVRPATDALERVTLSVFAPLFFGVAGLRADLGLLLDPTVALIGALTLLVASVGKIGGVYLAASWLGHSRRDAFGMGAGLNARGAMEIVIAALGLELGILSLEIYTVVLGVAVLTSAMAPPMLRRTVRRAP